MSERKAMVATAVVSACSVAANGAANWADVPTEFQVDMVLVAVALAFSPLLLLLSRADGSARRRGKHPDRADLHKKNACAPSAVLVV
ncbi:hypothetical protein GCM10018962_21670 [Dactylosporangium matsuzakiense]|uniref:Uncharacterized protein n=1 Tax=Dactylosporangium matsuzakiense TaxID=53360 RepID=A0A9W6KGI0_9ACTN|nr:hypothetical protein GCM10017581_025090 [Dactylosporangium matsuzakiense]